MATGLSFIDSLFPASFRGLSFFVETDIEHGGRRLVVYEYPHGEDHDVEDLGKSAKHFRVTAYLVGDTVLSQSKALKAACDKEGAGTLILPEQGTQQARCQSFERNRSKDQAGYIGFELAFVLEGGNGSVIPSVSALAQAGFDAIGDLASTASSALSSAFALTDQASWVLDSVVDGLTDIPATLETMLSSLPVDPTQVLAIGGELADTFSAFSPVAAGAAVTSDMLSAGFDAALALSDALPADIGAAAFGAALDAIA